jgi:hypothetical protein
MDGERSFNDALNQVLKLEAAEAAAEPPARLEELRSKAPWPHGREEPRSAGLGSEWTVYISEETTGRDVTGSPTTAQESSKSRHEEGAACDIIFSLLFHSHLSQDDCSTAHGKAE